MTMTESIFAQAITITIIHTLALMSPGPDFVMVSKNALAHSRAHARYTSIGLSLGVLTHSLYCIAGLAFVISRSILLFSTIKLLGAGYLIFLGIKALRSKPSTVSSEESKVLHITPITHLQALKQGYITNILNPKVTLFMFSVFTQILTPETPLLVQATLGVWMMVLTFIWFSIVGNTLTIPHVLQVFKKVEHRIERFTGAILVLLGIRIAISGKE